MSCLRFWERQNCSTALRGQTDFLYQVECQRNAFLNRSFVVAAGNVEM